MCLTVCKFPTVPFRPFNKQLIDLNNILKTKKYCVKQSLGIHSNSQKLSGIFVHNIYFLNAILMVSYLVTKVLTFDYILLHLTYIINYIRDLWPVMDGIVILERKREERQTFVCCSKLGGKSWLPSLKGPPCRYKGLIPSLNY